MKLPKILILALTLVSLFATTSVSAQKMKSGPQDLTFFSKVDETNQPYSVYIPENFDENKRYPLVIFLHGAFSNNRLGLRRVFGEGNIAGLDFAKPGWTPKETDLEVTRSFPALKSVDYIAACPNARGTAGYQGIPEEDVYEMLDDLKDRFSIDEDRIYLTGLSMGGGGTIWLGLSRPDIWAAIAPVCPAPPADATELAPNALNIPTFLTIGDKDFLYQTALTWKKLLEDSKTRFEYIEYPGVHHNSWEYFYQDGFVFDWFAQFKRDLFPNQVRFNTKWFKYDKAYWVTFDKFTPGVLASIDAAFTGRNALQITTKDLDAFTLQLNGHGQFMGEKPVSVRLDGKDFTVRTAGAVSFSKVNGQWHNKKYAPNLNVKRKGAEGPLAAVIGNNHVFVYGTEDNPSQEVIQARRREAALAADWKGMSGQVMIFPRVISDKEVRQSDYDHSNLILFGTKETNGIIRKFADQLPVHLKADAKDTHGLVYIFPMNGKYLLINSGKVWWTPPANRPTGQGIVFSQGPQGALANLKDFILFNGTPDNVVSEGFFNNNWALPDAELAKIKASAVVEVK